MSSKRRPRSLSFRLRQSKAALLAVTLTLIGLLLIMLASWLADLQLGASSWIQAVPFGEFGGILVGAGVLGTLFEYTFRKDQQQAITDQFRTIIREQAPTMRDAVVEGFAIHPEDLKRVANPQLLDDIASNVMSLRLGDKDFAHELYTDIRNQAIQAHERWRDVDVRIRMSTAVDRSTRGTPVFDLLVEWEYTTTPSADTRKFACTSSRDEYEDLRRDLPVTSTWLMTPRPGMEAASRDCYELLEFAVDGKTQPVRRSSRKTGQTYTTSVPADTVGRETRIRQVFRTITPTYGHQLFFRLSQPAKDINLQLDYSDADIAQLNVTDLISSHDTTEIFRNPKGTPGNTIGITHRGWLLPKAGYVFTWTLQDEMPHDHKS